MRPRPLKSRGRLLCLGDYNLERLATIYRPTFMGLAFRYANADSSVLFGEPPNRRADITPGLAQA